MTDENNSAKNGSDTAIGASAVGKTEPEDPIPSKPATEADLEQVEKRMSGFERSTLRWTRASFVIVLATAVFICLQWLEMRSGGKDTHDLAVAAKAQAQAAEAQAKSSAATANLASETLKASLNADRPWIGGEIFNGDNVEPDKELHIRIQVINAGKRPGDMFLSQWDTGFYKTFPKRPSYRKAKTKPSRTFLVPGARSTTSLPITIPRAEMEKRFAEGESFYFYGEIDYLDSVAGQAQTHTTHICEIWVNETKQWWLCNFYNDAD